MSRFKLEKQNNQVILIDTQKNKTRIITPDDIDYIIDDNQKLRDDNIIITYFKMKEDSYKPKTITKKANIVEEYKQAIKNTKIKEKDYLQDFLLTFNLSEIQMQQLAQMPYIDTIKKFNINQETKQKMIDSFKNVIESLNNKGIKNVETYIKNYLEKIYKNQPTTITDLIVNEKNYKNHEDYTKVKEYIKNEPIKSLNDLYELGIKRFANIELDMLEHMLEVFHNIQNESRIKDDVSFVKWTNEPKLILAVKYKKTSTNNWFAMLVYVGLLNAYKNDFNTIINMFAQKLLYFNTLERIIILINTINTLINANQNNNEIYAFKYSIGCIIDNEYKQLVPSTKNNKINFRTYDTQDQTDNQNKPSYIMRIGVFAKALNFDSHSSGTHFEEFRHLVSPIITTNITKFAGKFGGSWSDDTLTRIDNILKILG